MEIGNHAMYALVRKHKKYFLVMRDLNLMRAVISSKEKNTVALIKAG